MTDSRLIADELLPHFTAKEYARLRKQGVFAERPTELLEGVLYEIPSTPAHRTFLTRTHSAVVRDLGTRYSVRVERALQVKQLDSVPSPDVAILTQEAADEALDEPSCADLVIEGAGASLIQDRSTRLRIYARARIPEYVIANLKERQLEVYSVPDPKRSEYRQSLIVTFEESWRSGCLSKLVLRPKELFGPSRG